MKSIRIAVAAAILATSGGAAAQSATDARCILLANVFAAQTKDPGAQKVAEASLYFYLGRINPNESVAQMKALFDQQSKTITDANAGQLMGDCVKPVQEKVQLIQTLSKEAKPPATPQGR